MLQRNKIGVNIKGHPFKDSQRLLLGRDYSWNSDWAYQNQKNGSKASFKA